MNYLSLFSGMEAAHLAWFPLGWECAGVAEIEPAACQLLAHRINASRPKYLPDPSQVGIAEDEALARITRIAALSGLPDYGDLCLRNLGDVSQVTGGDVAALGPIDVVIGGSPCQDLSVAGKRAGLAGARSSLFHEQLRIFNAARSFCGARWLVWENVPGAFSSNAGRDFAVVAGAMAGTDLVAPARGWGSEGVALGSNGLVEWCVLDAQWFGVAQRRRRVFAVLDTGDWANRTPVLLERDGLRGDSAPRREVGEGVAACLDASFGRLQGCSGQDMNHGHSHLVQETANTLRADGFDASEDGTGRGTPLVPVAIEPYTLAIRGRGGDSCLEFRQDGTANALLTPSGGRAGMNVGAVAVAFSCKDHGADAGEVSPTLRAMGHSASHANAGGQVAIAFDTTQITSAANYSNPKAGDPCHPLTAGMHPPAVATAMAVRRLIPKEAERLQGAPDDWTLVPNKHGKPMADGPRYKLIGNSFAIPCITWIGRQIQRAHEPTS